MRQEKGATPAFLGTGAKRGRNAPTPPRRSQQHPRCVSLGDCLSRRCPLTYHRPPQWGSSRAVAGPKHQRSEASPKQTNGANHHLFGNWRYPTGERLLPHPSCPASHAGATHGMRAYVPQSDLHANRLWRFGFERTSAALSHMKHGSESTRAEPPLHRCTRRIGRAG